MTGREPAPVAVQSNKFRLDKANGKLAGVCAGLGKWMNIDPLIVRLVFAIGTLVGFGSFLLIYAVIWLLAE
mgnify:CR=1 FL=1|tara:strand:- start:241 stop:453 length:213 start_codon:yes stop_codon:yes gene_type:complete